MAVMKLSVMAQSSGDKGDQKGETREVRLAWA